MKALPKIEMIHGDCMDYMAGLPDNAFDLAIVDPPYGIGINGQSQGKGGGVAKKNDYLKKAWDKSIPNKDYFNNLFSVSKNQIIWGGNYFSLPPTNGVIVWKKMDISNDFTPFEIAWTSNLKSRLFDWLWCGMWQQDMKNKETRIHPTQKPVALYKWLLTNYAKPGDRILDTHGGSGSIAIACHDLGFDLVWIEKDKDYYEAAVQRFKNHTAQLQLF